MAVPSHYILRTFLDLAQVVTTENVTRLSEDIVVYLHAIAEMKATFPALPLDRFKEMHWCDDGIPQTSITMKDTESDAQLVVKIELQQGEEDVVHHK